MFGSDMYVAAFIAVLVVMGLMKGAIFVSRGACRCSLCVECGACPPGKARSDRVMGRSDMSRSHCRPGLLDLMASLPIACNNPRPSMIS